MKTYTMVLFTLLLFVSSLYAQFVPGDFEGTWRGTWFNNTFQSTDSAFLYVTIDQGASTLEAILDLEGNVFGGSDPDPVTLSGPYSTSGFSASGNSNTYGDIFLSGDTNANMTGRMPNIPNPALDSTTLTGTYNETNIDLTYIVYFTGGGTANGLITLVKDPPSGVEELPGIYASSYALYQNYPNPFNPSTKISWLSPVASYQTLKVYDVLGNEVATLVDEYRNAGNYEFEFSSVETHRDASLPSGIYFYQLKAGNYIETKKMTLMK